MAEKDWQPGSPGQALGLKFNLNFSLKQTEQGGGRTERGIKRENSMLQSFTEFFIWNVPSVARLQYLSMVIFSF